MLCDSLGRSRLLGRLQIELDGDETRKIHKFVLLFGFLQLYNVLNQERASPGARGDLGML